MVGIAEDSVRFAHFGPSHNLLRPAIAELVSCGPLPLPVSGGVDTPPQSLPSSLLKIQHKNIAILLIVKGIAIVNVGKFCYI